MCFNCGLGSDQFIEAAAARTCVCRGGMDASGTMVVHDYGGTVVVHGSGTMVVHESPEKEGSGPSTPPGGSIGVPIGTVCGRPAAVNVPLLCHQL